MADGDEGCESRARAALLGEDADSCSVQVSVSVGRRGGGKREGEREGSRNAPLLRRCRLTTEKMKTTASDRTMTGSL